MKRAFVVFGSVVVLIATGCQKRQPPKTSGGQPGNHSVVVKIAKVWHTLSVEACGAHFVVTSDGKLVLDAQDGTFKNAAMVDLWTRADSIIAFHTFAITGH